MIRYRCQHLDGHVYAEVVEHAPGVFTVCARLAEQTGDAEDRDEQEAFRGTLTDAQHHADALTKIIRAHVCTGAHCGTWERMASDEGAQPQ